MKRTHSTLAAIIIGTGVLGMGTAAHAAAKIDFTYAQIMALIEGSGGDIVVSMVRFVSSNDTEPTVHLENCATAP